MEIISVFEAKNKLSALIKGVEEGKSYLISRNGKPVAELHAHKPKDRLAGNPALRVEVNGPLFGDDGEGEWECVQ